MKVFRSTILMLVLLLAGCGNIAPPAQSVFPSPVAYVTPAPLPMPTITPTLPPVAKPTAPPATAVPKKQPIDSTAAIGLWGDRLDGSQAFGGFLDLASGGVGQAMAKQNIALVTLGARQVYFDFAENYTDTKASRPNWFLQDKDGKLVFASNTNAPLLNIREPDVRSYIAGEVAKAAQGFDGIVIDGLGADLIRPSASPIFSGTKPFSDTQRQEAAESLLRAIRASVPDKLLIMTGYAWKDGTVYAARTGEAQDIAGIADGVHISEWLRNPISGTKDFKTEAGWKRDVDYLSAISADGKVVLVTTRLNGNPLPAEVSDQWLSYSLASFLMGKNGPRTYFQFDLNGSTLSSSQVALLNAQIGAPDGSYTKLSSGLFARKFSNGIVFINASDKTLSADLDAEYKTMSGATVKKVTLAVDNGLVLLKP
ncbi:MAG TPA: putative glycoside hydrolase [Thermoflexales bacterium]|nr:putative glycoside hydrolase [Thermoflexales bacterium]HQW35381.1 putative glycoside hydrolase [Thermoflexales bacterium]HQX75262.1 putative glycoside hydrolase [Thermoflexales bacterium]HQZ22077.1 putative glycoside hydrolase [Thermoflexales bacterium]HRA00225.1 putative glycoside hydrolase [Thermoflexales bacterium]